MSRVPSRLAARLLTGRFGFLAAGATDVLIYALRSLRRSRTTSARPPKGL